MSDNEDLKKTLIQSNTEQGINWQEREFIDSIRKDIVRIVSGRVSDPRIAYVVLLKALGGLIALEFPATEHQERINLAMLHLPLYVQAYTEREIK